MVMYCWNISSGRILQMLRNPSTLLWQFSNCVCISHLLVSLRSTDKQMDTFVRTVPYVYDSWALCVCCEIGHYTNVSIQCMWSNQHDTTHSFVPLDLAGLYDLLNGVNLIRKNLGYVKCSSSPFFSFKSKQLLLIAKMINGGDIWNRVQLLF